MGTLTVPYVEEIERGVKKIVISGSFPQNSQRLAITLGERTEISQMENLALHVSIQLPNRNCYRRIEMRHRFNFQWRDVQHKPLDNSSNIFDITIVNNGDFFIVDFNGIKFEYLAPRGIPVKSLLIQGDIDLDSIKLSRLPRSLQVLTSSEVEEETNSSSGSGLSAILGGLAIVAAAGGLIYALTRNSEEENRVRRCGHPLCGTRCHCTNCSCMECRLRRF